jgi:carbonic anhydrase/acetyltransferase-like protein (isoleucine patch superfamily)
VVHCREVGEQALVGNGSTLLDGAVVGARTLVAAGSVVTPGAEIPGGMVASGIPARPTKPIEGTSSEFWIETNPPYYQELAQRHAASVTEVAPVPLGDDRGSA